MTLQKSSMFANCLRRLPCRFSFARQPCSRSMCSNTPQYGGAVTRQLVCRTYTSQPKPCTVVCRMYTSQPKPCTVVCRTYTSQPKPRTVVCRMYTSQPKPRTVVCRTYTSQPKPCTVPEALRILRPHISPSSDSSASTKSLLLGYSQYSPGSKLERVICAASNDFIINNDENIFDSETVLDVRLAEQDVDVLCDEVSAGVLTAGSGINVYNCEFDSIAEGHWQYGFTVEPFCVFSEFERILLIDEGNGILQISVDGDRHSLSVSAIRHISLEVSEEPYSDRYLNLVLTDGAIRTLIRMEDDRTVGDLASLTIETEWLVKVAGLLCAKVRRASGRDVKLKMSSCLLPGNNEWAAMRQKLWADQYRS